MIGNALLCADHQRYRPTILCGSWHKGRRDVPWHYRALPWYTLWWLQEGSILLHRPNHARQRINGPAAILIQPSWICTMDIAADAQLHFIECDPLIRPLQPRRSSNPEQQRARKPFAHIPQPDSTAIWGVAIPAELDAALHKLIYPAMLQCCTLWWRDNLAAAQADAIFGGLLAQLAQHYAQPHQQAAPEVTSLFAKAEQIASESLHKPFTVDEWSRRLGLSRQHFTRQFTKLSGHSPSAWLNTKRLERALMLLPDRQYSIAQIAQQCGFRSSAVFGRFCKQQTGLLPSQLRG